MSGTLDDYISNNKAIFLSEINKEVSSILNLHLSKCLLHEVNLIDEELYNEISLHAYAYHQCISTLAHKIMFSFSKNKPEDSEGVKNVYEKEYIPRAWQFIKEQFLKKFDKKLNKQFYSELPNFADYVSFKYLSYFLPKSKLPKLRKPKKFTWESIWGLNKETKADFDFILNTAEFTKYKINKKQKRKKGYDNFCEWCKKKITRSNAIVVKTKLRNVFVCSKKCADAARVSLKRNEYLKTRFL